MTAPDDVAARAAAMEADAARCECGKRLASPDEVESGLCARCLYGPVPHGTDGGAE